MQLSEPLTSEQAQPLPGVQLLLNFVLSLRAGKSPSTDNDVMILGGGRAALEAARAIVKQGSKRVSIVVRTNLEDAPFSEKDVKGAEEEGIRFYFETAVTKMAGVGDRLTQVELTHLSSRGEEGSQKEFVEINTLLTGAGRFPELMYVQQKGEDDDEVEEATELSGPVKWETLVPYAGPFAQHDIGVFRRILRNLNFCAALFLLLHKRIHKCDNNHGKAKDGKSEKPILKFLNSVKRRFISACSAFFSRHLLRLIQR